MRKFEEGAAMQVAMGRARHGCRDEAALGGAQDWPVGSTQFDAGKVQEYM